MAFRAPHQPLYTVEEYLELEAASEMRHEFVDGQIHAMSGATRRHNRIVLNATVRLFAAARGTGCRVYSEAVKLRAAPSVVYYPDIMVACGPEHDDQLMEHDPCLIVEVTSPSTRRTDRREKALVCKNLPTLRAYVVVHQDRRRVEWYLRQPDGRWSVDAVVGSGVIDFPCPTGVSMTLDEIYEGAEPPPLPRRVREGVVANSDARSAAHDSVMYHAVASDSAAHRGDS